MLLTWETFFLLYIPESNVYYNRETKYKLFNV